MKDFFQKSKPYNFQKKKKKLLNLREQSRIDGFDKTIIFTVHTFTRTARVFDVTENKVKGIFFLTHDLARSSKIDVSQMCSVYECTRPDVHLRQCSCVKIAKTLRTHLDVDETNVTGSWTRPS